METAPVQYAIVDGAVEEGLLDFLNEVNPPHCSGQVILATVLQ